MHSLALALNDAAAAAGCVGGDADETAHASASAIFRARYEPQSFGYVLRAAAEDEELRELWAAAGLPLPFPAAPQPSLTGLPPVALGALYAEGTGFGLDIAAPSAEGAPLAVAPADARRPPAAALRHFCLAAPAVDARGRPEDDPAVTDGLTSEWTAQLERVRALPLLAAGEASLPITLDLTEEAAGHSPASGAALGANLLQLLGALAIRAKEGRVSPGTVTLKLASDGDTPDPGLLTAVVEFAASHSCGAIAVDSLITSEFCEALGTVRLYGEPLSEGRCE